MNYLIRIFVLLLMLAKASAYMVDDIVIEGNDNISDTTIISAIEINKDVDISDDAVNNAIKKIYATGFFQDVQVFYDNKVLTFRVTEKPMLAGIDITGNDDVLKKEELDKIYDHANADIGHPLSDATITVLKNDLKEVYVYKGYNKVSVDVESKKLDKSRVQLKINIGLGSKTKISSITIKGNKSFSDSDIKGVMGLSSTNLFSFFLDNDSYSKTLLDMDVAAITRFYMGNGFLDCNVVVDEVDISDSKDDVALTVRIVEGPRYKFAGYKFSDTDALKGTNISNLVKFNKGDMFSREKVKQSVNAISEYLSDNGHANAIVQVKLEQKNQKKDDVEVLFSIKTGKVYKVRNISFKGNYITDDILLRRSMSQYEGEVFNKKNITESERKLVNLSYIKKAICSPSLVPNTNLVDINCDVEESMASVLTGKVGFSDTEGFLYGASYSQDNFLGTGNKMVLEANKTEMQADFKLSHTWPYFTDDGVSVSSSLFYRETTPNKINISNYNTDNYGFTLGFGFPVAEHHRLGSSISLEHTTIKTFTNSPTQVTNYINTYGDTFNQLKLGLNWSYSNLDRFMFPSSGQKHRLTWEFAVPYNDDDDTLSYYRIAYNNNIYLPLFRIGDVGDVVFMASSNLGYGNGFGNQDGNLPWFKNFFAGGLGTVRGYASNSLGPLGTLPDGSNGKALGGNIIVAQSFNLILPQKFSENIRFSLFLDAGNVFEDSIDWDEIRYSAGFSIQWRTAMAPLVFSFGFPLNLGPNDKKDVFAFSLSVGG